MGKKVFICLLAAALATAGCPPVSAASGEGHWAGGLFSDLLEKQIIAAGEFEAADYDAPITRGRFINVFMRLLGASASVDGESRFADVSAGSEYYAASAAASDMGLVSGYSDGTFRQDATIQRQELFAIVGRALPGQTGSGAEGAANGDVTAFTDGASVAAYAREHTSRLVRVGVVKGYGDDTIRPTASVSCAEAMAVALRAQAILGAAEQVAGEDAAEAETIGEVAARADTIGEVVAEAENPGKNAPGGQAGNGTGESAGTTNLAGIFSFEGALEVGIKGSNYLFPEIKTSDAGEMESVFSFLRRLRISPVDIDRRGAAGFTYGITVAYENGASRIIHISGNILTMDPDITKNWKVEGDPNAFDGVVGRLSLERFRAEGGESIRGRVLTPPAQSGHRGSCKILTEDGNEIDIDLSGAIFDIRGSSSHMYLEKGDQVEIFPPDPEKERRGQTFIL
jgi:hypothetical protein